MSQQAQPTQLVENQKTLDASGLPQSEDGEIDYDLYREILKDTNINEQTLLATDYLNHFNEVVMLMGMIPDMPECLEDVVDWKPKSYEQHFSDSGFSDKDLAVAAYIHAPPQYRNPFDKVVGRMNDLVEFASRVMSKASDEGDNERLARLARDASQKLQKHIDKTSAIIHGNVDTMEQTEIDGLLNR